MENKTKEVMSIVFSKFYENSNAKKKIENFFSEFDEETLSKFFHDIQGKVGSSEELIYESETKDYDYYLEYDCVANYLSMKIYYKDSPNIIEKRLSTFAQFVQRTISEEYDYLPSFTRHKIFDVTCGVQAGVVIEEYGKDIGEFEAKKQNGENVATIKVANYLKQCCFSANEDDEYVFVQNKIFGGDATFENFDYKNCGYVEQRIERFDDVDDFSSGRQRSKVVKRNLFALADANARKDLFSEVFDFDNLKEGDYEIMCHSTTRFGVDEDSKYYVRKCGIKTDEKIESSLVTNKMCEISKEKYYLIQDDTKFADEIVNLIQENKEGRNL